MATRPSWLDFRIGGVRLRWWIAINAVVALALTFGAGADGDSFNRLLFTAGAALAGSIVGLCLLAAFSGTAVRMVRAYREGEAEVLAGSPQPARSIAAGTTGLANHQRARLVNSLIPPLRQRHAALQTQAAELRRLMAQADDPVTRADSLRGTERLEWLHLKLIVARQHVGERLAHADADALTRQAGDLRRAIADPAISNAARQSRSATLAIIDERLRNHSRLRHRLDELESDLARIEAQLALGLERAVLHSGADARTFQLDLASRMVDDADYFGAMHAAVRELDRRILGSDDAVAPAPRATEP